MYFDWFFRSQITFQSPVYFEDIISRIGARDETGLLARLRPRLIEVNYKSAGDEVRELFFHSSSLFYDGFQASDDSNSDSKAIPVISDIERIKKVIEIIEFVGGKVDQVLEKLPTPESMKSDTDQRGAANGSEAVETTEATTGDQ